ncbi:uncharacterized protein LOC115885941 isoform X1 [Sitophilus oryzae]|uniref:Uncharacterized protein LOC115885941 isoform X1 n=1 Tax=Sitophilus oryzae TaxID=7048 RepID=A0A6J2YCC8_SITOR|nr:uncharacterized protein LOC115885941 isoform X1 [Sitophilus oryzae]
MFTLKYLFFFAAFLGCFYVCTSEEGTEQSPRVDSNKDATERSEVKWLVTKIRNKWIRTLTELKNSIAKSALAVANVLNAGNDLKEQLIAAFEFYKVVLPHKLSKDILFRLAIGGLQVWIRVSRALCFVAFKILDMVFRLPINLIKVLTRWYLA